MKKKAFTGCHSSASVGGLFDNCMAECGNWAESVAALRGVKAGVLLGPCPEVTCTPHPFQLSNVWNVTHVQVYTCSHESNQLPAAEPALSTNLCNFVNQRYNHAKKHAWKQEPVLV